MSEAKYLREKNRALEIELRQVKVHNTLALVKLAKLRRERQELEQQVVRMTSRYNNSEAGRQDYKTFIRAMRGRG